METKLLILVAETNDCDINVENVIGVFSTVDAAIVEIQKQRDEMKSQLYRILPDVWKLYECMLNTSSKILIATFPSNKTT